MSTPDSTPNEGLSSNEIGLISTDELIEELKRRYSRGIFAWSHELDGQDEEMGGSYWGGKASALGLAVYMEGVVQNELISDYEDGEDE